MRYLVWLSIAALLVLHQDYWQWDNSRLVFGFVPYCLAYHTVISIATAAVWLVATTTCWPVELESSVERQDGGGAK